MVYLIDLMRHAGEASGGDSVGARHKALVSLLAPLIPVRSVRPY